MPGEPTKNKLVYIHKGNLPEWYHHVINRSCRENKVWSVHGDYVTEFPHFPYIHSSGNTYEYERFCFERWLLLNDLLFKSKEGAWYCDSDNVVYEDINQINTSGYDCVCIRHGNVVVPCLIYFSPEGIASLAEFIFHFYFTHTKEQIEELGGMEYEMKHFSDMWLIAIWLDRKQIKYKNIMDERLLSSYNGALKIVNGDAYFQGVKMISVHYNGMNKINIPKY